MSRKRLMRGIKRIVIFLVVVSAFITVITLPSRIHKAMVNNFCENAEIIEIVVNDGHGIDFYSSQFKPSFIEDMREYRQLIIDLNDLPKSGAIYSGQIIKFYK